MKNNEDFNDIYEEYLRFSARIAFRIVRDRSVAEDIAQDVFYNLYKLGDKLDISSERKLRSLITTATINKTKDYLKKAHIKWEINTMDDDSGIEVEDESFNPELRMLRMEEKEYRKLALARLRDKNPMNYDILLKIKGLGISPDSVAEEYGITRNNVNNRVRRTKIWLNEELSRIYRDSSP